MKADTAAVLWIVISIIGLVIISSIFKGAGFLVLIYLWPIVFFTLFSHTNSDKEERVKLFLFSFIPIFGNFISLIIIGEITNVDEALVYNLNRTHVKYLAYLPFLLLFAIFFI